MKCPTCKETNLVMSERRGVEIDYCPDCRGIWLDRGELDKILEASIQETSPVMPARSEPREDSRDSRRDSHKDSYKGSYDRPYKRKKSFLEELFD